MYVALILLLLLAFLALCLVGLFTLIKQAITDPPFTVPGVFIEDPLPSSSQCFKAGCGITLGSMICSGVCAWVQTMNGGAIAFNRHPVAIRSICCAALRPSLPAQIITA